MRRARQITVALLAACVPTVAARMSAAASDPDPGEVSTVPSPSPSPAPRSGDDTDPGAAPGPHDPLAGFAGDRAFVRSPGNTFVLFLGFQLLVDGAFFPRQNPKSGAFVRRARVEVAGWMGPAFYYDLSGDFASAPPAGPDPVAASALAAADDYLAIAPWDDALIVQAGQFDAPFTLENRTPDPYTDFIERSLAVRALGAPTNKEVGLMVHGALSGRTLTYAAGVFNGDGPNFRNVDNQVDFIGRVVLAPLAHGSIEGLRGLAVGVSGWYGQHLSGLPLPTQTTAGGFVFLDPRWTSGQGTPTTLELHQHGAMMAVAAEANLPLGRTFGVRAEGVFKRQDLGEDNIARAANGTLTTLGVAHLQGIAAYGEAWLWLLGDERQLPPPGLQLPQRLGALREGTAAPAVMLALRAEVVKEDMTTSQNTLGDPNLATTRLFSGTAGVNYWLGRRVRLSANYVVNVFSGTTERAKALVAAGVFEHEILLRFGMSL